MTRQTGTFAALILMGLASTAQADGDIAKGEKVFRKCTACHSVDAAAPTRAGPSLYNIVNRPVASLEGFAYSDAMKAGGGAGDIWTEAQLDGFIADPKSLYKGHKMAFAGVKKPEERVNLIAFLKAQAPAE